MVSSNLAKQEDKRREFGLHFIILIVVIVVVVLGTD